MRYDKVIYFCTHGKRTYNEDAGDYTGGEPERVPRAAAIMDTSAATQQLVYDGLRTGSLVIHTQTHYDTPFDYIMIDGSDKRYHVDNVRALRTKESFVVSEIGPEGVR